MSKDKVGKTEIAPSGAQVCNEPEVNLTRRRALIQAGWAVPTVLAVGLAPRKAKAPVYVDGVGPLNSFRVEPGDPFPSIDCPDGCSVIFEADGAIEFINPHP